MNFYQLLHRKGVENCLFDMEILFKDEANFTKSHQKFPKSYLGQENPACNDKS